MARLVGVTARQIAVAAGLLMLALLAYGAERGSAASLHEEASNQSYRTFVEDDDCQRKVTSMAEALTISATDVRCAGYLRASDDADEAGSAASTASSTSFVAAGVVALLGFILYKKRSQIDAPVAARQSQSARLSQTAPTLAGSTAASSRQAGAVLSREEALKEAFLAGVLTAEEYERKHRALLGVASPEPEPEPEPEPGAASGS